MEGINLSLRALAFLAQTDATSREVAACIAAGVGSLKVAMCRLHSAGHVEPLCKVPCPEGSPSHVWRITPRGRQYLQLQGLASRREVLTLAQLKVGDEVRTPSGRSAVVAGCVGDRIALRYREDGDEVLLQPHLLTVLRPSPPHPMPPGFMDGADRLREGRAS